MTAPNPAPANDAAQRLLDFLRREAPKAHAADELAALLSLDLAQVQTALDELHTSQQVVPETVSGYGGSATLWTVAAYPGS